MEEIKPYKPQVRELASRIYAELVVRATTVSESAVKMTSSPHNLAKLSFKLADAFQEVEDELNAANLPKNVGYKIDAADIAQWTKKT